ncbi:MAG TPA: NDP-sugar synthase [Blastocatellia bacterium]|nr:NDP-sugar synthase [Blastocatellia bacterium]
MQALILAGGEGTRLRPLTVYTPKPVVAIANRPFLFYQIDLLQRSGIKDISLALGYQPSKIADIFGDGHEFGVHIRYVVETTALGTAGAYKNAVESQRETTVVFNGDIITDLDLAAVVAWHREQQAVATIVLTEVENPAIYGLVETDPAGRVRRFIEKPNPEEITCQTINAGIYVLEPRVLDYIPPGDKFSFEYQLFPALLRANEPIFGFTWSGYWIDIGTPQRYLKANHDLLKGEIQWFEVDRKPYHSANDGGTPPLIDQLSVIDPSCTLKPGVEIINSVLGPNCFIEERARIENSVLLAGARVGKATEVRGSVIGKSVLIGRFARVENSVLGDKSSLTDYTFV